MTQRNTVHTETYRYLREISVTFMLFSFSFLDNKDEMRWASFLCLPRENFDSPVMLAPRCYFYPASKTFKLLTHRISRHWSESKNEKVSRAGLLWSYFLSVAVKNSPVCKEVIFLDMMSCVLSAQKKAKCINRRNPPCTRRGAPHSMPTSTVVASCMWWWKTGRQSWNLKPRWLWTRWQQDARRRTASWRSGLV